MKKKSTNEETENDVIGRACFHVATRFTFDIQKVNVSTKCSQAVTQYCPKSACPQKVHPVFFSANVLPVFELFGSICYNR